MQRGSFFVEEHILINMSFLSYVQVSMCTRHALEPTRSLFICAVSPLIFFLGGHVNSMVYVTAVATRDQLMDRLNAAFDDVKQNPAVLADRCCDDIKHAMRHRADCFNTYCKNMPFSIKWYVVQLFVFNSDPYGRIPYLRITHKRHVCEYMFLHKKLSSLHGLSSLSFCRWGPVTPCILTSHRVLYDIQNFTILT